MREDTPAERGPDADAGRGLGADEAGAAPDHRRPAAAAGAVRFPWPPAEDEPVAARFVETWTGSVFRPAAFFSAMPVRGGLGGPILYYLVVGIVVAGIDLFWQSLFVTVGERGAPGGLEALGLGMPGDWSPVVNFLLSPVILIGMLFVASAVVHLLLLIFGGARNGYGATVRVFCFAYSPRVFSIVPLLGGLVGFFWMVVVSIVGLREAHRTDGWRAAVAVLAPLVLLLGLFLVVVVLVLLLGPELLREGLG